MGARHENRREIRKLSKQRKSQFKKLQNDPLFVILKDLAKSGQGTGDDLALLKSLCLACVIHPEPISITYLDYDENVFAEVINEPPMPVIYYQQESDGKISKVVVVGEDTTESFRMMVEATEKDFKCQGRSVSESVILIDSIKAFNLIYESLGEGWMDVCHAIYSKRKYEDRLRERQEMIDYWSNEYQTLRHLIFNDVRGGV